MFRELSYQEKVVLAALSISRDNINIRGYEIQSYDSDGDLYLQPWADMNAVILGRTSVFVKRRNLAPVRVSQFRIYCKDDIIVYDLEERVKLFEEQNKSDEFKIPF